MRYLQCDICESNIMLDESKTYVAINKRNFKPNSYYDVVDCPVCGCQRVLGRRLLRIDEYDIADSGGDLDNIEKGNRRLEQKEMTNNVGLYFI